MKARYSDIRKREKGKQNEDVGRGVKESVVCCLQQGSNAHPCSFEEESVGRNVSHFKKQPVNHAKEINEDSVGQNPDSPLTLKIKNGN